MPILGEGRKYRVEQAALHNGVRRKPLERVPHGEIVSAICGVIILIALVSGAVWLLLVAASQP